MVLQKQFKISMRQTVVTVFLLTPLATSAAPAGYLQSIKQQASQWLAPPPNPDFNQANIAKLSAFDPELGKIDALPTVTAPSGDAVVAPAVSRLSSLSFQEAIMRAVQRHPEISQSIAELAMQNANIDVARAGYYPQLSGGLSTADLTKGERGRQLVSLEATQMLYDFGKVSTEVGVQHAQLTVEQASVLVAIDNIAYQVADAIVNIKRYKNITDIAQQQIQGVGRIAEIANLRAKAGISSQADPIQAQSNLEAARANYLIQQNQLLQYQQKLRTLLGVDVAHLNWQLPDNLVNNADIYKEPEFNLIPKMMLAYAEIEVAQLQKQQTRLSNYPTINLKGSVSQAVNGRNPNNDKDDGFYNSIMLEASSAFYQGGAVGSKVRAANHAEQAARARLQTAYLSILDEVRLLREEVENKQKQMGILMARHETAIRTKELYQEQYKLGTRTLIDLLNAEQAIHSAAQEIETARYDIYVALVKYISQTGRTRSSYDLNDVLIQGFEVQS